MTAHNFSAEFLDDLLNGAEVETGKLVNSIAKQAIKQFLKDARVLINPKGLWIYNDSLANNDENCRIFTIPWHQVMVDEEEATANRLRALLEENAADHKDVA